jgi:hypothetical protein
VTENPTNGRNIDLGPGNEFDLVRTLLAEWGKTAQRIGDDAAVLEVPAGERLIVTTDTTSSENGSTISRSATARRRLQRSRGNGRPIGVLIALDIA